MDKDMRVENQEKLFVSCSTPAFNTMEVPSSIGKSLRIEQSQSREN